MTPLEGRSYDLHWPQDADRSFQSSFNSGGVTIDWQLSLSEIRSSKYKDDAMLDVEGFRNLRASGPTFSSSSSGGLHFPELSLITSARDQVAFFSVARSGGGRGAILMDLTPVRDEDPLRTGTFDELLAVRGSDNTSCCNEAAATRISKLAYNSLDDPSRARSGSPAEALIEELQGNLLILLAAAVLLAQLFQRRSLGFVKAAACLLLYVGALDRVVLRIHESRLGQAGAPAQQRLVACGHLPSTAFFRKTALGDLEATASDPSAPPSLRDLARRLAEREKRNHFP